MRSTGAPLSSLAVTVQPFAYPEHDHHALLLSLPGLRIRALLHAGQAYVVLGIVPGVTGAEMEADASFIAPRLPALSLNVVLQSG